MAMPTPGPFYDLPFHPTSNSMTLPFQQSQIPDHAGPTTSGYIDPSLYQPSGFSSRASPDLVFPSSLSQENSQFWYSGQESSKSTGTHHIRSSLETLTYTNESIVTYVTPQSLEQLTPRVSQYPSIPPRQRRSRASRERRARSRTQSRGESVSSASSAHSRRSSRRGRGEPPQDLIHHCPEPGCGRTFERRSNLNSHRRTHDPDRVKLYPCQWNGCSQAFDRPTDLERHIDSVSKATTDNVMVANRM